MHTIDSVEKNIEKLADLFPNCVSEVQADNGEITKAIDFELLKQELSRNIVEGSQERYQLNWPGKREAILAANAPIAKTLRPARKESVNFDSTENLFIEGDNLDALKLIQESYLGKVKMIYIDPPYNTGNDFVYEDNFAIDTDSYIALSNQKDEKGNRLVVNQESNGRFHSDWLTMMYSRLKLARNLLADDGVIFVSIDDCEYDNLKKIMTEIFGESNFYCSFVWKRRSGAMDSTDNTSSDHEYVIAFGKNKKKLKGIKRTFDGYSNPDNDPRGSWKADNLSAGKPGGDVYYPIRDPETGNEFLPPEGRYWPYSRKTMATKIEEGRIIFPKSSTGRPMLKRFELEAKNPSVPVSTWMVSKDSDRVSNSLVAPLNTTATKELQNIFGKKVFSHPKSTQLIKSLASQCLDNDDIILDFFAGSATTAEAVMQMNSNDNGKRKFILIQLPEKIEDNAEATKLGYKNIADLSKDRIRMSGCKYREDNSIDVGFRVLKVESSNMAEVYYNPDAISQADLFAQVDNVKEDRTEEDLLFQVMLDWGVDLTLPIRREAIDGKTVFFVAENALVACFDKSGNITESFVKQLAEFEPMRLVFRDAGFASDSTKINVEQVLKQLSPTTDVKSI
ncbi:site-specific DNA-methyltransferase [Shewanella algae]|uniref:site-specific DNA-methyltransferase n=1 Tax=Shewanella algae TaxID=38313 RepID=UPI00214C5A3A|nr:site-specific DNA-methyltransferase [Shewanella algae]